LVLEPVPRDLPAQGAWNGQRVVLGTGEILLGPALRGWVAALSITGDPGKWQAAERKSEGVVVAIDGRDNTTRPERRTPASSMHAEKVRNPDECRAIG
jgi:hypothetical protein